MKSLLEVMSLEVPAESVGTVGGAESWRQTVPDMTAAFISQYRGRT